MATKKSKPRLKFVKKPAELVSMAFDGRPVRGGGAHANDLSLDLKFFERNPKYFEFRRPTRLYEQGLYLVRADDFVIVSIGDDFISRGFYRHGVLIPIETAKSAAVGAKPVANKRSKKRADRNGVRGPRSKTRVR